jgi:glycosyltransferase involved in cell wall biosynthesis
MLAGVRLSVVIPAYNEEAGIAETVRSATVAIRRSPFENAEIVVADDGSTDGTAAAAAAAEDGVPVRVETLPVNSGRFVARRFGLDASTGDYVLFIDAGVTVNADGLAFVGRRLESSGADVWNAHTILETDGNPLGHFWAVVSALAFPEYMDDPRTTSFDAESFDRFPKGTTCFFAPRALLAEAFGEFRSRYDDPRNANDDGPLLRSVAERRPIHISPGFACTYRPRSELGAFVRHALHRGVVFLDGHGRRESRFFPVVVAFYPVSVLAALAVLRRPRLAPFLAAGTAAAAGAAALRRRRSPHEVLSFALLTPVYAAAHGLGMWKGLGLALRRRPAGSG